MSISCQMLTNFQISCTSRFISKCAIKSFVNILLHLNSIATLPYEILRSENSDNVEHCTVISDKLQGSVAAHLRCGGLFSYHLTMYLSLSLVVKKIKIGECVAKLQAKRLIALCALCTLQ